MLTLVPQFELEPQPMEIVFLVDCSGSMGGERIEASKHFGVRRRSFIEEDDIGLDAAKRAGAGRACATLAPPSPACPATIWTATQGKPAPCAKP